MAAHKFCEVTTVGGEYRALIEAESIRPLDEKPFAAKVKKIIVFRGQGPGTWLDVPVGDGGLHEFYGKTESEALSQACDEFKEWALLHGGRPQPPRIRFI